MGWIKDAWYWVLAKDRSLDADQKLSRWTNLTAAVSVVVSVVGWLIGLLFSVPWQLGLLSGLVAWVVLLNTVVARVRGEVRKEEATTAEQVEQLKEKLSGVERERDELVADNERLKDRASGELKQRAIKLSGELFRFAQGRDKEDPQHDPNFPVWIPEDQEAHNLSAAKTRYDDETWSQYRQRYEGELRALLSALERYGWCDSEERKEIEGELDAFWRSPSQQIERVAARLDAFGKRL